MCFFYRKHTPVCHKCSIKVLIDNCNLYDSTKSSTVALLYLTCLFIFIINNVMECVLNEYLKLNNHLLY